jgi:hypothetical protein
MITPLDIESKLLKLNDMMRCIPLDRKQMRHWHERHHKEKLAALSFLNNPPMRDMGVKKIDFNTTETWQVNARETTVFDTLLENIPPFTRQQKGDYHDFIITNQKIKEGDSLNLFTLKKPDSPYIADELPLVKELSNDHGTAINVEEGLYKALLIYRCLCDKVTYRKFSALYIDFLSSQNIPVFAHINFPLVMLHTYGEIKIEKDKKTIGRRSIPVKSEDITLQHLLNAVDRYLQAYIKQLSTYYRQCIGFDSLHSWDKIRVNYMISQGFTLPSVLDEKGFTAHNPIVIALMHKGYLSKQDLTVEGSSWFAELLEKEGILIHTQDEEKPFLIHVGGKKGATPPHKWAVYNQCNEWVEQHTEPVVRTKTHIVAKEIKPAFMNPPKETLTQELPKELTQEKEKKERGKGFVQTSLF